MHGQAIVTAGDMRAHHVPNFVRYGDAVAVEVHREGRHDMCLCPVADGGRNRLPCEHMRAVERAIDHTIQQYLPIGLRLERHKQPLIKEVALLIRDGQRRHIRQFNEAKCQLIHFEVLRKCGTTQRGRRYEGGEDVFHGSVLVV